MTAAFAIASALAAIWSVLRYQAIYNALIASFPLEFRGDLNSRYAFPLIALSPSTSLPLQADYVKSLAGGSFAMLCFSLSFFSFGELFGGWLGFGFFLLIAVSTIKSWKTYKANANRQLAHNDKEEPWLVDCTTEAHLASRRRLGTGIPLLDEYIRYLDRAYAT